MARVKRGVTSHAKHKKTLEAAKGFYGRRKNTIRAAKAAVDRSMQYATRDRRAKKRVLRALWIQRLNAAVRPFGLMGCRRLGSRSTARSCQNSPSLSRTPSGRSSKRRRARFPPSPDPKSSC